MDTREGPVLLYSPKRVCRPVGRDDRADGKTKGCWSESVTTVATY
ncbi:hypothetical protein RAJCM14343_4580 [Rhodococcus aetherivorans]|uniref:Uncharacterized protein n=1 Tax=Rhodococcus aetherivorans TaxID=191292 RepID=A0ABQ0YRY0_9NOCA|nr:hypothetical protein RAJCM14343_4580 [Rhodococcus aetherivorans]CCW14117.1 hypothetical protein EBESD8_46820 [Rhodococcus aetherivorans]